MSKTKQEVQSELDKMVCEFKDDLQTWASDLHIEVLSHDSENFQGCTHIVCNTLRKVIRMLE